jgi:hypothetical protein
MPAMQGSINRRYSLGGLHIKQALFKITNEKRAGSITKVVERLLSKYEVLRSNHQYHNQKKPTKQTNKPFFGSFDI